MSYQVLARKWRPNNFSELVGQEHVVTAISNGLAHNRLHHAYLFTGTRGVGKTTIARILSKSLNCEVQVGANPCGQCPTCKDIEQGRYVDLLEIDAASRTKVEDTRELLDNVQYKPTRGRYKVYLIDEVHMLSKHSFNALLKTLEEPPEHVKFLLATTDPQKLPITILSRCLQFNLKALSRDQIKHQIKHILSAESIDYQDEGISHLAHAAQGSMRDALSLTDQAIASGNGQVSTDVVTTMLGLLDRGQLSKLLASVLSQDSGKTFEWVESLASQSPDYSQLMSELLALLHQIALTQFVPDACKLETSTPKVIYQLASKISPEHVQLCYQIVLQGKRDLPYAADGRSGLEMTLLRMLAFKPATQKKSTEIVSQLAPQHEDINVISNSVDAIEHEKQAPIEAAETIVETAASVTADEQETGSSSTEYTQLIEQQNSIIQQAESLVGSESGSHEFIDKSHEIPMAAYDESDIPEQTDNTQYLESGLEQYKLQEESGLSSTESLIAMKQQLKDLNKKELEEASHEENSGERDFESLSFSSKKDANDTYTKEDASPTEVSLVSDNQKLQLPESIQQDTPPFDLDSTTPVIENEASYEPGIDEVQPPTAMTLPQEEPSEVQDVSSEVDGEAPELVNEHVDPTIDFTIEDDVEVTISIEAFSQKGEKIVGAKQIDQWSDVIERMDVRGLTKQLALHANYSKNGQVVTLLIAERKSHLNTDIARAQIKSSLEHILGTQIELQIAFGVPVNTPFAIQQKINKVRHQYAYQLLERDENIAALKRQFDATIEPKSTFAR